MSCPTLDELLDAFQPAAAAEPSVPGEHDAARAVRKRAVHEHAANCPACARRARLIEALHLGPLPPVPAGARKNALRALARHIRADELARTRGRVGAVLDLVARLVYDSLAQGPQVALRGNAAPLCHLLYEAGPFEVDLALLRNGSLVGQFVGQHADVDHEDWSLAECRLLGAGRTLSTELEETGEFRFQGVQPGSYELLVEGAGFRVQIPRFELRASGERESEEDQG